MMKLFAKLRAQMVPQLRYFIGFDFSSRNGNENLPLYKRMGEDCLNHFEDYHSIRNQFIALVSRQFSVLKQQENESMKRKLPVLPIEIRKCFDSIVDYPSLDLPRQFLQELQKHVSSRLHLLSNEELNSMCNFYLKADPNFTDSLVHLELVKFYVGQWQAVIRAKYGISLENKTMVQFINELVFKMATRSFLSRRPPYQRVIAVIDPQKTLLCGIGNSQFTGQRLFGKIFLQQFHLLKKFYEEQMKSNLYHSKNHILYYKLSHMLPVLTQLYPDCQTIDLEIQYLRELYLYLHLVCWKQASPSISFILMYDFIRKYQQKRQSETMQKKKLRKGEAPNERHQSVAVGLFKQFVQQTAIKVESIQSSQLNSEFLFQYLILFNKYFPINSLSPQIGQIIIEKLSPITLSIYLSNLLQILQQQHLFTILIEKITAKQYIQNLKLNSINTLLGSIQASIRLRKTFQSHQQFLSKSMEILKKALEIQIQKDYQQISSGDILGLFQLYQNSISISNSPIYRNLISGSLIQKDQSDEKKSFIEKIKNDLTQVDTFDKTLRVFLFRYLSDNHAILPFEQFTNMLRVVLQLDDWETFDDLEGHYSRNIYEQLQSYIEKNKEKIVNSFSIEQKALLQKAQKKLELRKAED